MSDYMGGHNMHGIGFAAATQNAVDETAANYQAHIDMLQRKLQKMGKQLEETNALFDDVVTQRNAWRETCREFANGAPRETVLAVYERKKVQVKQGQG